MKESEALKIILKHGSAFMHDLDDIELNQSIQEAIPRKGCFPWGEITEIISATISLVPLLSSKEVDTKLTHSYFEIIRYLERTSRNGIRFNLLQFCKAT